MVRSYTGEGGDEIEERCSRRRPQFFCADQNRGQETAKNWRTVLALTSTIDDNVWSREAEWCYSP